MHMEAPSSTKLAVLTRCILVACLMQSNYAEVCFIRSHRGYGGCLRWFLPAEKVSTCTSIKLGGYATTSYKRSQIIEFDQPFVSDISGEVQDFLEKQVPSLAPSHVKTAAANSMKYTTEGEATSDQILTATVSKPTAKAHMSQEALTLNGGVVAAKNPQILTQPSSDRAVFSTTECPLANLTCSENMTSRELNLENTYDDVMDYNNPSEEILRQCGSRKILVCGCESEGGQFFPIGVTYQTGKMCRCYGNGTLTCYRNTNVGNIVCDNLDDAERIWFVTREEDSWYMSSRKFRPTDCHDFYNDKFRKRELYCIYPTGWHVSSLMVLCDMDAFPTGGWTVLQRRVNGSINFHRNWTDYKDGFGKLSHEFWLGNENIYRLTSRIHMQLRIDIKDVNRELEYAVYECFRIDSESNDYRLIDLGDLTNGALGHDALRHHVNASFSTYDRDTDLNSSRNCAEEGNGGWWFTNCSSCYLNGVYGESQSPGIFCSRLPGGEHNITSTEMKIRPID